MMIAEDLSELIGKTPLLKLSRLFPNCPATVMAKLELFNPTSIKDRPALNMIRKAMAEGRITSNTEVVEATSGNTGIGLASLAATLGFPVRLYMSETCSIERQKLMCAYGATIVLTPAAEYTRGARDRAIAYCEAHPETTFFANQHGNPDNGAAHFETTGPELWEQTGGNIGAVVIGMGTCGTIEGLSGFFKGKDPSIHIVGVEPAGSPVYSGGKPGEHHISGIGPGMLTENFERARDQIDEILLVEDETTFEWARRVTRKEGLIAGPTSGATLWGAAELAKRPEFAGKNIICFLYDTGERYLSVDGLFETDNILKEA
jgi:cysteine synthase A